MRLFTLAFALLLFLPFAANADIVFHEEFDDPEGWMGSGNPPDGWTIYDDDPGTSDWHQGTYGSDNAAYITRTPIEYAMGDSLIKYDIVTLDYWNLELSYFVDIHWNTSDYYSGIFYVYGSNDQFSMDWHSLLWVPWPDQTYSGGATVTHHISSWGDDQDTVGVWFGLYCNNSWAIWDIYLDEVHIEGDYDTVIQPTSLGKIKAMYE